MTEIKIKPITKVFDFKIDYKDINQQIKEYQNIALKLIK